MFGPDILFDDTIQIIMRWTPKQKYSNENQYRAELIDVLRKRLTENVNPFGPPRRVNITKEDGRGLCDIAIDRKIGIELKKDLKSKSQIDRLIGQITEYETYYRSLIILLVGNTDKNSLDEFKYRVKSHLNRNVGLMPYDQGPIIRIVDKGSEIERKEEPPKSPFDFNPFKIKF